MKSLFIIDARTKGILCVVVANGKTHDFKMLKDSRIKVCEGIKILADLGFWGY